MSSLTRKQRRALEEFAELKISIDELRERLQGVLEFDFKDQERKLTSHYGTPIPGVRIELENIQAAMDKHARGEISTEQLADWATMLLLNDAYDWEGPKEEQIADWLNDISMLTLKSKAEADPSH
jgi:hypothetical protein